MHVLTILCAISYIVFIHVPRLEADWATTMVIDSKVARSRRAGAGGGGAESPNLPTHTRMHRCGWICRDRMVVQTQCWYPRDVGCRAVVVYVAYLFPIQFSVCAREKRGVCVRDEPLWTRGCVFQ